MRGAKAVVLSLILALTLTGCSAWTYTQSLFVSAVSLDVVGEQFLQVTAQVQEACNVRSLSVQVCERYKSFHDNFQRAYPAAVGLWKAADKAGDTTTKAKAEDVIRSLSHDLTSIAADVLSTFAPENK